MQVFKANTGTVSGICFTPDGRGIVTGSSAGVVLWDLTTAPRATREFGEGGYSETPVAVSPCGRFLAVGMSVLRVLDLSNERRKPVLETGDARTLAFAPDGSEFAAPGCPPRRWAVPSWKAVRRKELPEPLGTFCSAAVAYAPDGRTLAQSFGVIRPHPDTQPDAHIRLFDRATGAQKADLKTPFLHAYLSQLAFSPDGKVIAGNFGPVLGVVSVADGKEVARIKIGTKHITALAFTPDGSKLVTVSNDTRVRVFDAHTWKETHGYEWKIGKLRCVAVAPDGLRMAAGSDRGKVVIWDVDE